ncbi:MAG: hypothetical protein NVS1B11_27860 [Terriglobales bacterium]
MNNRSLKDRTVGILAASLLIAFSLSSLQARSSKDKKEVKAATPAAMKLKVGDMAPDFAILSFDGKDVQKISLSDYRGKKSVALAFYVFAFTGG